MPVNEEAAHARVSREVEALQSLPQPVRAFAADYPQGYVIEVHRHSRGQLIHAEAGLMAVEAGGASWLVPPGAALWMPAEELHEVRAVTAIRMRTLYIRPDATSWPSSRCRVITVSPLLRELILRAVAFSPGRAVDPAEERLMAVILDEVGQQPEAPLSLPLPTDRRARRVADALLADPADDTPIEGWTRRSGASGRTLARLFRDQTGLTLGQWRQRRKLLAALERLAAGEAITAVALDLGYGNPSAFSSMFRRSLGHPPSRYLSRRGTERNPGRRRP